MRQVPHLDQVAEALLADGRTLRDLLGVEVDEQWPIADGLTESIDYAGDTLTVPSWSEWLEADDEIEIQPSVREQY